MTPSVGPAGTVPVVREAARDVIVVTGRGSAALRPTHARLDLGLQCRAGSPGEALAAVTSRAEAVVGAARSSGLAGEELQTRGLSVAPHFDDRGDRVVGYWASYALELTVRDVPRAASVIDAVALAAGDALRLGGFRLETPVTAAERAQAAADAVRDARDHAERLAAAAGAGLGRVLEIVEEPPTGPPVQRGPVRVHAMAAAAMAPPIEEGVAEVVVYVRVTFAIAD